MKDILYGRLDIHKKFCQAVVGIEEDKIVKKERILSKEDTKIAILAHNK